MPSSATARADRAFRANALELHAPPTVFYVNLTERCQLSCAHCITHAPRTTAEGRARSLSPEVLLALSPHLAHARYVGFTHSGEPTLSPSLVPFLDTLRARRKRAQTTVHVVTNGVAVTERRFLDLCARGLTSWSFSLDGVSPETNDALRVGSRIEDLLPRITRLSKVRREQHPQVRLGVSCTVTRSNVHELEAMVRFVASAGLDWLKLEETFPVNERARAESELPPGVLRARVDAAERLAAELALPLVNHTQPHEVWKCEPAVMDEPTARFAAGDDFANRRDINPCRSPWEVVCIEPDGEVKPQDFHQPAVGNLLQQDLLELWNAPGFVGRRREAVVRRRCSGVPSCPRPAARKP